MAEFEQLIATVRNPELSAYERRRALVALQRVEGDAGRLRAVFLEALEDEDRNVRREAIECTARLNLANMEQALLGRLGDSDEYVRREAIGALARVGSEASLEHLQALLDDASYAIRNAARGAVGAIEARTLPPPLPPVSGEAEFEPVVGGGEVTPVAGSGFVLRGQRPNWSWVPRLRAFFGAQLPAARSCYETLFEHRETLLAIEAEAREVQTELQLEQAAKSDTLEELEVELAEHEQARVLVGEEIERLEFGQEVLQRKASGFGHRLVGFLLPGKKARLRERLEQGERGLALAHARLAEQEAEVDRVRTLRDSFAAPLEALQQTAEARQRRQVESAQDVAQANEALLDLAVSRIDNFDHADLQAMVEQLAELSGHPAFLEACVQEIRDLKAEQDDLELALMEHEQAWARDREELGEASDGFGKALAGGFRVVTETRRVEAALHGAMQFSGRVRGSAHGVGKGTAQYEVQEIRWDAGRGLDAAAQGWLRCSRRAGASAGEGEYVRARLQAVRFGLRDYARFLLREMEGDFSG